MKKTGILLFLLVFSTTLFATEDYYSFNTPQEQKRFELLISELRCLVCQNQNLAESNAPLATDLRDQIYRKIQEGTPNQDIVDYLVSRYGDFILYRPPFKSITLGLWFGPLLILVIGLSMLLYYIRKRV